VQVKKRPQHESNMLRFKRKCLFTASGLDRGKAIQQFNSINIRPVMRKMVVVGSLCTQPKLREWCMTDFKSLGMCLLCNSILQGMQSKAIQQFNSITSRPVRRKMLMVVSLRTHPKVKQQAMMHKQQSSKWPPERQLLGNFQCIPRAG
jgi:hypothetical protein